MQLSVSNLNQTNTKACASIDRDLIAALAHMLMNHTNVKHVALNCEIDEPMFNEIQFCLLALFDLDLVEIRNSGEPSVSYIFKKDIDALQRHSITVEDIERWFENMN
jgi:lipoate-protein ligase B